MWRKLFLCLLVGLSAVSSNPAWKPSKTYVYNIRGRTLAGLHEISNQYSGIFLKAKIFITPQQNDILRANLKDVEFAQIHSELVDGWKTNVLDSELSYKPLPMSSDHFEIFLEDGIVKDIKVEQKTQNWESNVIRSIVSQFQWDVKAKNLIKSHVNILPEKDSNNAVFKTMEDTITGTCETLYDIHPLPEYVLQSHPDLASKIQSNEQIIEVVKTKNYTNSEEKPLYHFGLSGMGSWQPGSNQMGEYFIRSSISRAFLSGNLEDHTIEKVLTVNKIIMSPTLKDMQKGSVVSYSNVTLEEIRSQIQTTPLNAPISLGNLVYRYNSPFGNSQVRSLDNNEEFQEQPMPQLARAPSSPLLPFTMGYKGNSIKKDPNFDIVQAAKKLAQEIEYDFKEPENLPKKDTLTKFMILASLTRIMDLQEMEKVGNYLYGLGETRAAWVAFRDVVAECGTGPALLTIGDWIITKKIKNQEAGEILTTMAHAVRTPTDEYIRNFYELVKTPAVRNQAGLNDSAILTFCNLVRKVYVSKSISQNEYPVNSFGMFQSEEGKKFVEETLIPELKVELKKAIAEANTQMIHVYIRALGNVGDRRILDAFKPCLEGKKQVSQFQRLMMVVALDKLVKVDPEVARSVLYKIYQNEGETQEIRAAAVYQLIRTNPPTEMLQRMAEYTNYDNHEIVNAAVKSSIESAAKLNAPEFEYLKSSALASKPLLTKRTFSYVQALNHLKSYVANEYKMSCKETLQTIGDENSFLPKALKYAFRTKEGGLRKQLVNIQTMVSSISELTNVFDDLMSHKQHSQQNDKLSNENVAKWLKMEINEREQLEGFFNMEMGGIQKFWSFDNHTIEQLPKVLDQIEEILKKKTASHKAKFVNSGEIAISFPTELGFPFLYTYDTPTLLGYEGQFQVIATPELVENNKFNVPQTIEGLYELRVILTTKIKGKLSFITPFNHQQYSAGYDKVMQVNIPIRGKINVNLRTQQIKTEWAAIEKSKQIDLFHYSSWPYTSKTDIMNMQPISLKNHIIRQREQRTHDKIYGNEEMGLAFQVKSIHENEFSFNFHKFFEQMSHGICIPKLWSIITDEKMQFTRFDVNYLPEKSTTVKVVMTMGRQQQYKNQGQEKNIDLEKINEVSVDDMTRQQELLKKFEDTIQNGRVNVYDASIEFQGEHNYKYSVSASYAKDQSQNKQSFLWFFKKYSNRIVKPYRMAVAGNIKLPHVIELDLTEALRARRVGEGRVQAHFGLNTESSSKVDIAFELKSSDKLRKQILNEPIYKECKREMEQGNHQLSACANLTRNANILDEFHVKIQHQNLPKELIKSLSGLNDLIKFNFYPSIKLDESKMKLAENEVVIQARFNKNMQSLNFTTNVQNQKMEVRDIEAGAFANCYISNIMPQQKSCVVDKEAVSTFNNLIYPIQIEKQWTVVMQYLPIRAKTQMEPIENQVTKQRETYLVMTRQNEQKKREVKVNFRLPENKEEFEITLKNERKIVFNGEEIILDRDVYDWKQGLIKLIVLKGGEIQLIIRNDLTLAYDGLRLKVSTRSGKFRNAIKGICGSLSDDKKWELVTADGCIVKDVKAFVESYVVEEGKVKRYDQRECFEKRIKYINVISERDIGRTTHLNERKEMCLKHQTRYVEEGREICFSLRPMPICKCQERGVVTKNVAVHCLEKNNVALLWKNEIDKGASPDFSMKSESRTVQMQIPIGCSQ